MNIKNLSEIGYENYAACVDGRIINLRTNREIKQMVGQTGYMHVSLSQDGVKKRFAVHRLVMIAFEGFNKLNPIVNHRDGDKTNNNYSNLEWCTYSHNALHAVRTGLKSKFKNEYRQYDDSVIHSVCKMIVENNRTCDIRDILGVPSHLVCNVRKGFQYKDISSLYDFSKILPVQKRIGYNKIKRVCELLELGYRGSMVTKETGVSAPTVSRIKNRLDYTDVSVNYKF